MKKIAVASGKYMKEGVEKTSWVNVVIINTSANGKEYALIDPKINFAGFPREPGKDMVMCSIFDDSQQQQPQPQGQYNPPNYGQQATPQNNIDNPSRHNVAGGMNRPAQHQQGQQQVQYAEDGSVIPF